MKRVTGVLLVFISLAVTASSQQRPLITDDIDIVPAGSVEIAAGVDFLQNVKFPLSGLKGDLTKVGDIRIRQGFASNVEIQIEGVLQNFLALKRQVGALRNSVGYIGKLHQ